MERVGSHTKKTTWKHNLSGFVMESSREERKRKTPKKTWNRELETEIKKTGMSWKDLEKMVLDKKAWRDMVADPCLHGSIEWRRKVVS
jgi:hypothetical protein